MKAINFGNDKKITVNHTEQITCSTLREAIYEESYKQVSSIKTMEYLNYLNKIPTFLLDNLTVYKISPKVKIAQFIGEIYAGVKGANIYKLSVSIYGDIGDFVKTLIEQLNSVLPIHVKQLVDVDKETYVNSSLVTTFGVQYLMDDLSGKTYFAEILDDNTGKYENIVDTFYVSKLLGGIIC